MALAPLFFMLTARLGKSQVPTGWAWPSKRSTTAILPVTLSAGPQPPPGTKAISPVMVAV